MWDRLKGNELFVGFAVIFGICLGTFVLLDFIIPGTAYVIEAENRRWGKIFEARRERWKQEDATQELEEAK